MSLTDHFHDPFDPLNHAEWLTTLGHRPLPDGRCEHRWRNRTTRPVRCAFLDGFRAALAAPDSGLRAFAEDLIVEIGSMMAVSSWSKVETEARRSAYNDVLAVISDRLAALGAGSTDEVRLRAALATGLADALTIDWPGDTRLTTAPAIADYLLARPEVRAALSGGSVDEEEHRD